MGRMGQNKGPWRIPFSEEKGLYGDYAPSFLPSNQQDYDGVAIRVITCAEGRAFCAGGAAVDSFLKDSQAAL